jgi:DNA-binding NtrC family response regulator
MTPEKKELPRILVIEDIPTTRDTIRDTLQDLPAAVDACVDGGSALDLLVSGPHAYRIVVVDQWVPKRQGLIAEDLGIKLLKEHLQLLNPGTPMIVFTAHPTYRSCVAAIKAGAHDYIPKLDVEDGLTVLTDVCRRLLYPEPDEMDLWLKKNAEELEEKFGGCHISLIKPAAARTAGLDLPVIDDEAILARPDLDEIRKAMLEDETLRWVRPRIFRVPKTTE